MSVLCDICYKDISEETLSCDSIHIVNRGDEKVYLRILHPRTKNNNCGDCGVSPGGIHHFGCDTEICPKCGGQLISCGCFSDPVIY